MGKIIKIQVPFRGQGTQEMNTWLLDQGLVYRRDWVWDRIKNNYVFWIDSKFEKQAQIFALKWMA